MRTSEFHFDLPQDLIAQTPAEPRDSARLMVLRRAERSIAHHVFRDLPELLASGDLLVVNDTRVMAARLLGVRPETLGVVEVLLLRPLTDRRWEVLFRPARQAVIGRTFVFSASDGELHGEVVRREAGTAEVEFDRSFDPATVGSVPLPPYIKGFKGNVERYQTVYSKLPGSAAAPTAGLHFTPGLLHALDFAGVTRTAVTLDVGPGTFKPVQAEDPHEHVMHAEHFNVPNGTATTIAATKAQGGRVVAVGTTVVRTLEHVVRERKQVEAYEGWTSLRILPGDSFAVVDVLITNFHLPRSTLLMLVSAFAGQDFVLEAYRRAVADGYRFYSFGDAMLILP
jgi:S-adenosylmethionine:tRNA ribosyltransferase-isomerase